MEPGKQARKRSYTKKEKQLSPMETNTENPQQMERPETIPPVTMDDLQRMIREELEKLDSPLKVEQKITEQQAASERMELFSSRVVRLIDKLSELVDQQLISKKQQADAYADNQARGRVLQNLTQEVRPGFEKVTPAIQTSPYYNEIVKRVVEEKRKQDELRRSLTEDYESKVQTKK